MSSLLEGVLGLKAVFAQQTWIVSFRVGLVGSLVKAMVFPVVMYGCESWTVKKAEHQKIDAF